MRYRQIIEGAQYNNSTGDMEIDFDPATIPHDRFRQMMDYVREMRQNSYGYVINGMPFPDYAAASQHILALLQPRIAAKQAREEAKRTAWHRSNYASVTEMVPTAWLARLAGNDLRYDPAAPIEQDGIRDPGLLARIEQEGIREPVLICVGKRDRHACVSEGNHRVEVARRLDLPAVPARVLVQTNASRKGRGLDQHSYDVADDLLIPSDEYVPADMRPSQVFRSLSGIAG